MAKEEKEEKTPEENQKEKDNSKNQSDEKDVEKLEKDLKSAIAQKKSYREKFEKLQDLVKDDDSDEETPEKPKESASDEEIDTWREKVDFMLDKQQEGTDIKKEDVELLERLRQPGQALNKVYEENDDLIELRRQQRIAEQKPNEPSGPASSSEESEDLRKKLEESAGTDEEVEVLKEALKQKNQSSNSGV